MPNTTPQYIGKLRAQQVKLEARIQLAEARSRVMMRKQDTRRKILIGSYYLDQALKQGTWEALKQALDPFLTRASDRVLFDLPVVDTARKT